MCETKTGAYVAIGLVLVAAGALSYFCPEFSWGWPWYRVLLIALDLYAIGFLIRWWAIQHLAGNFSLTLRAPKSLCSTGPYRYIRHPCYLGTLWQAAGLGCLTGNWLGLAGVLVGIYTILHDRISAEECLLTREFGLDYLIYVAQVPKRLIPFIY